MIYELEWPGYVYAARIAARATPRRAPQCDDPNRILAVSRAVDSEGNQRGLILDGLKEWRDETARALHSDTWFVLGTIAGFLLWVGKRIRKTAKDGGMGLRQEAILSAVGVAGGLLFVPLAMAGAVSSVLCVLVALLAVVSLFIPYQPPPGSIKDEEPVD